jgi:hypothetical protein
MAVQNAGTTVQVHAVPMLVTHCKTTQYQCWYHTASPRSTNAGTTLQDHAVPMLVPHCKTTQVSMLVPHCKTTQVSMLVSHCKTTQVSMLVPHCKTTQYQCWYHTARPRSTTAYQILQTLTPTNQTTRCHIPAPRSKGWICTRVKRV